MKAILAVIAVLVVVGSLAAPASAAPLNDDFSAAQAISGSLPEEEFGSNFSATKEVGEPSHAGNAGGSSVWYSWTAASSGPIRISTCSYMLDTLLAVYTGSAVNALTPVASNDDTTTDCSNANSIVEFNANAGTTYTIAVDGKAGQQSSFTLKLEGEPGNDDFAGAEAISGLPEFVSGSNRFADKEAGEPNHAGASGGHSVWFAWTAPDSEPVAVSAGCDGELDTLLAVYTGSAVNALTPVASNDDGPECSAGGSDLVFSASAGTTYYIAVDARGGGGQFELELRGRPANDDFADATVLSGISTFEYGNNKLATRQPGEPDHAGDPGGHSVWYSLTPATSGKVELSTYCNGTLDSVVAVYTGSAVNALTPVASNDDKPGCFGGGSDLVFTATAGTTYRIAIDGKGGDEGPFTLEVSGPPANDSFAAAQSLGSFLPTSGSGTTKLASKQPGEPNHAGDPGGRSVWYSWTASASGQVDVSTCSYSAADTLLAVYTGSAVNALTPVASNDNAPGGCEETDSDLQFNAVAGTTYRIVVDARGSGSFSLNLTGPPANDDFANAQAVGPALPSYGSSNNRLATKQPGEPNHAGNAGGGSVWFSWTAPSSGVVEVSSCSYGSKTDTLLAVYTGSAVNALTPVASNDDSSFGCNSGSSAVTFTATAGVVYSIAVDSKSGGRGSVELNLRGPPVNDEFANATALAADPPVSVGSGTTRAASKQPGEPNHAGNPGSGSVWYSWTPSVSGPVQISTCSFSSLADTLLAVYTGSAVNALTPVASNDDRPNSNSGCPTSSSLVRFDAVAGTTYRIAVDGKGGRGNFGLYLVGPPQNDEFASPKELASSLSASASGTNLLASKQAGEPKHAGEDGGASVWYSWTAPSSGPIAITTCSYEYAVDTLLAVYTGSAVNALTPVASNDDSDREGCSYGDSRLAFTATAGVTYRIAVDGIGNREGQFSLDLVGRPDNDSFAQPRVLPSGSSTTVEGSNVLATKQAGEPSHAGDPGGGSVWFSWTPSSSGQVDISACGLDTLLAVYTGSAVNALTPVASNDDSGLSCGGGGSDVQFNAVAGTTYRIAVDGRGGEEDGFSLRLSGRPANDDFAAAQVLGASLGTFAYGSNVLAAKQAGEPNHGGEPGGSSVWYSWTAPSTGTVSITICVYGSRDSLDPVLGVYTGAAVNSLTPVALTSEEGWCESGTRQSFAAVAGTTYGIAVDGRAGGQGSFELNLSGATTGSNDDFANAQTVTGSFSTETYGNNEKATKQAGEPNHAGNAGGGSVWFSWTAPSSGTVDVSACSFEDLDTLLAVYTGSAVNALTPVASNDDDASGSCRDTDSSVQFSAVAGTAYKIAVDGKAATRGGFELRFTAASGNDDFDSPRVLNGNLDVYASDNNKLATKQPGEPNHAGNAGGRSVWFSWTAPSSGAVVLHTCSSGTKFDTLLAVYTGSSVGGLTPVASNDDDAAGGCRDTDSAAQLNAVAGTTYRIAVDGKNGTRGFFGLNINGAPANDDLARAASLGGGLPKEGFSSSVLASKQAGEPNHAGNAGGHSIWFKWTAAKSGTVSVDTCGSETDTLLAVYTGSAVNALTPVASNDDGGGSCAPASRLSFSAVAGTTYKIAVDGKAGAQGSISLDLNGLPANDDFAAASAIGGSLPRYGYGVSNLATKQPGEPNHAGSAGGRSIWFKWTASFTGAVDLSACDSEFDTLLAVYTGSAVNALTPVASNDDGAGDCAPGSELSFGAVSGVTYAIAVDGAGGDSGEASLELTRPLAVAQRTLSLSKGGTGGGLVASSPAGIDCGSTCSASFDEGTVVTLSATPDANSTFSGWTGGGCSGSGSCQVTLSSNAAVTATFTQNAPSQRALTVSKTGSGTGTVVSSPAGISCGSSCSHAFDEATEVQLTPTPGANSVFAGWSGACSGTGACKVTLDQARGVGAKFDLVERTLSVLTSGAGTVVSSPAGISCGAACTAKLSHGTAVTLTATAAAGYVFSGWSGAGCSGTGSCQLSLTADAVLSATFAAQPAGGSPGGGAPSGGGGASTGASPTPTPSVRPPVKCKKGFKKKKVGSKTKCVKAKRKGKRR